MNHPSARYGKSKDKVLLTVAGFDPCGGAGVILDVETFKHRGFQGAAVVTSLTVQNTKEVEEVFCPPPDFVWAQYRALHSDMPISGIKIGMLGCKENIPIAAKILTDNPDKPRVVDPVLRSTSGTWLLEEGSVSEFINKIGRKATLLTPNVREAELISKTVIKTPKDAEVAASRIFQSWGTPCLIKGGHLMDAVTDILYDGHRFHHYEGERIEKTVHGTGCFLSATILALLAEGNSLTQACAMAIDATRSAISKAIPLGQGQNIISFFQD
ncbi:MAG: bifunctional hydroxymethylpyrimidine kinase/phosphomethylpyrimidine kinase [Candidatus Aminicenantes bacterium]|nr:bifunctional hydroxymethylpyrimidine kinase/phosphomethylpyrimidine kinase [Candidatus Aminicenantes bacterium]